MLADDSVSAALDPTPPPRLRLTPPTTGPRSADGAWWPRSPSLTVELPGLFAALADRLGPIALVAYHLDDWVDAPRSIDTGDGVARLEGFVQRPPDPHALSVVGTHGQHLTLILVAPGVDQAAADREMGEACRPGAPRPAPAPEEAFSTALAAVARRLTRRAEAAGAVPAGQAVMITQWVHEAARQFSAAPVQAFVPVLVEHIVRQRVAAIDHEH